MVYIPLYSFESKDKVVNIDRFKMDIKDHIEKTMNRIQCMFNWKRYEHWESNALALWISDKPCHTKTCGLNTIKPWLMKKLSKENEL